MKLSFVFPVINKENILSFWEEFKRSRFFGQVGEYETIFVVSKTDNNSINELSEATKKDGNIKIIVMNKDFAYNRAFREVLPFVTGGVVLLGDVGIENNGEIFEEMLKEYESGAEVVQVKIKQSGFGGFVTRCAGGVYNFFVKMFSENKDILNVPSLGLIDGVVIDIFKELPYKANFLRNAYYLEGVEMRTLYIDKVPVYKNKFNLKTGGLVAACALSGVTLLCLLALILINALWVPPVFLNIALSLVLIISFLSIFISLSKHVLDVRCDKICFDTRMVSTINTEKERPEPDIKVAKPRRKSAVKTTKAKTTTKKSGNKVNDKIKQKK
ncbi:MAG: hypothetical protein LBN07_03940 [Christensenellaceae bacterium]|jgi:hypothetical protein|nr:hypothetical protein [Christensenellaceae bacterium]